MEPAELVYTANGLTRYTRSSDFPPAAVETDPVACSAWYRQVFSATAPPPPDPSMSEREHSLYLLSAEQYIDMRRRGAVTCEEYASALVKRARYYRHLNQWIYTSYGLFERMVCAAKALDAQAASEGVEAIAPLYGLPIPMKGTAAVVEYPSGSGSGVLSGYTPVRNSALTELIISAHGLIFGCTNVPEFAASHTTANPASGHTRNPYDYRFTVGGSSGGAASAVAAFMCPIAVGEDTCGSTRVPAACSQSWGFDPARNHYPNSGNPGMSVTNDQLGLISRSLDDILLLDAAFTNTAAEHAAAHQHFTARPAADIRIGVPLQPFVETSIGAGLHDSQLYDGLSLQPALRAKLDAARCAIGAAGFGIVAEEWPSRHFDYLGRDENVCVEALFSGRLVNGKPLDMLGCPPQMMTFSGQMASFITGYLQAPVSLKDVVEDMGSIGHMHDPAMLHHWVFADRTFDETQLRYLLGPKIANDVAAYNSYFDTHGVDVLLLPAMRAATPDLAELAGGTVQVPRVDGSSADCGVFPSFGLHAFAFKHLHIPKLVVPTGLTIDGRPTAIQLWGRAIAHEDMYDDARAAQHNVRFLHLARRVATAMHLAAPELARADFAASLV